jgi:hypothetical protein
MKTIYNRITVNFHRGDAYAPGKIETEPFSTFIMNEMVDRDLIDAICVMVREYVNKEHGDFCNVKISAEEWDC